jgi:capsular exopolysaccharide synthesis family protein
MSQSIAAARAATNPLNDNYRNRAGRSTDWITPPSEQEGLSRYLETIRERIWLVVLIVAITTGFAILYVATATKTYEAEARVLVTPVPPEAELLVRVGLISESADPGRDVQTVASLVTTNEVATRAQKDLQGVPEASGTPQDLLNSVSAVPVAESNIIAITATAGTPDDAAAVANAFADGMIAERTNELHRRVTQQLDLLRSQLQTSTTGGAGIESQISQLEGLLTGQDPNLQVATKAVPPTRQASPRPVLSVAGGLLAGIVLGIGAAFARQALDPRLRREEQLRRLFNLPILARIPKEGRRTRTRPLAPGALSPAANEAYRSLRGTLAISARAQAELGRSILVTGSSPSDGKTTTAVNLAAALAVAGTRVILIEADLRRPSIGRTLDVQTSTGVINVLLEQVPLEEALVTTDRYGPNLGLLLADVESDSMGEMIGELFVPPAAERLLERAHRYADYVIVDSPPLTDVVDALPLARRVDQVLIVARIGNAQLDKLTQLGELLAENQIRPAGIVLVGTPRPKSGAYHYYHQTARRRMPRPGAGPPPVPRTPAGGES